MGKRDNRILEMLSERGRLEVTALAEALGVSRVTVRKDLDALEKRGILRREHGFAIPGGADDMNNRLAYHYEEKRAIAREAARLVSDGETVMIENGSCCALLAEQIARSKREVTIITNSAFIAGYIRAYDGARAILLGGNYQPSAQVMVGPLVRLCAAQFRVGKLFAGIDGFDEAEGVMANDYMRVQAVRDMAERANELVFVTESAKFVRPSLAPLNADGKKQTVVTDDKLGLDAEEKLRRLGINIRRACV